MEKSLSSVIQYMIKSFGTEILKDDSRFWAIFLDLSPQMERERKMLRRICNEHILARFFAITLAPENEYNSIVSSLKSELTMNQGFSDLWADELVDAFCEALGIEYNNSECVYGNEDSESEIDKELNDAAERMYIILNFYPDRKVSAIRYYREKYGCELLEAKRFVDSFWSEEDNLWETGVKNNSECVYGTEDSKSEIDKKRYDVLEKMYIILNFYPDRKVSAMRYYREKYGCGLREAVEYVEYIWDIDIEHNNSEDAYGTEDSESEMDKNIKYMGERAHIVRNFYPDRKVSAICYYQEKYGCELFEAKRFVDSIWDEKDDSWKIGVRKEGILSLFDDEKGYGCVTGSDGTVALAVSIDFDEDVGFKVQEGFEVIYMECTTPNQGRYATHIRPKIYL